MTRSDATRRRAAQIIARLTAVLDEAHVARQIDEPIDEAVEEFSFINDSAYSHEGFHRAIGKFVQHVYQNALPFKRALSLSHAYDEGVALLDQAYGRTGGSGYDEAVLDATDTSRVGLQGVLATMAEGIKSRWRDMYVRWAVARHIDPADWHTKCAVAAILLERCRQWLPPQLRDFQPAQLADDICELLAVDLSTSTRLQPFPTDSADPH